MFCFCGNFENVRSQGDLENCGDLPWKNLRTRPIVTWVTELCDVFHLLLFSENTPAFKKNESPTTAKFVLITRQGAGTRRSGEPEWRAREKASWRQNSSSSSNARQGQSEPAHNVLCLLKLWASRTAKKTENTVLKVLKQQVAQVRKLVLGKLGCAMEIARDRSVKTQFKNGKTGQKTRNIQRCDRRQISQCKAEEMKDA